MLAISLTSIPPRYAQLPRVLTALLGQSLRPDRVLLCLPRRHRRFAPAPLPPLPDGVEVLWQDHDLGPATKVIPAARALRGTGGRLIYCDDDWLYGPKWAQALLDAHRDGCITAGAAFDLARLKRQGGRIAQGYAGVLLHPEMIPDSATPIPSTAWAVDDIWLSAQFATQGLPIQPAPKARKQCHPLPETGGLQNAEISGQSRAQANAACAQEVHQRFGIWPPL